MDKTSMTYDPFHILNRPASMDNQKVKLMCSYGEKNQLCPHDHQLSYVCRDTKLLPVDRNVKFSDVAAKLLGEGLDALVSFIDDDAGLWYHPGLG
ncbi:hypothetical protein KY284_020411 [Solanum tuberosum]|nr:hypothetical protein KY284_020411 [Solanum tuberosum]